MARIVWSNCSRAYWETLSLFIDIECMHVWLCLSVFFKKKRGGIVSVCWEISSSSKSSLWAAFTKTATVWCFYYFAHRLCNPFFSVCWLVLEAISCRARAFIKMLFCDKCFLVTYSHMYFQLAHPLLFRFYHHHFYLFFPFFFFYSAFVMCWMAAGSKFFHCNCMSECLF